MKKNAISIIAELKDLLCEETDRDQNILQKYNILEYYITHNRKPSYRDLGLVSPKNYRPSRVIQSYESSFERYGFLQPFQLDYFLDKFLGKYPYPYLAHLPYLSWTAGSLSYYIMMRYECVINKDTYRKKLSENWQRIHVQANHYNININECTDTLTRKVYSKFIYSIIKDSIKKKEALYLLLIQNGSPFTYNNIKYKSNNKNTGSTCTFLFGTNNLIENNMHYVKSPYAQASSDYKRIRLLTEMLMRVKNEGYVFISICDNIPLKKNKGIPKNISICDESSLNRYLKSYYTLLNTEKYAQLGKFIYFLPEFIFHDFAKTEPNSVKELLSLFQEVSKNLHPILAKGKSKIVEARNSNNYEEYFAYEVVKDDSNNSSIT